jgi:RNA-directed DNA polymerase
MWESDGGIVAEKSGNADGAKAPWFEHACPHEARKTRLDNHPTTEEPKASPAPKLDTQPAELDMWSSKGKVRLPEKVAELRRKLNGKAKQEPKFRFYTLYDRVYRPDVLLAAWWVVFDKDSAAGVDGVCCQDILDAPGGLDAYLSQLRESLRAKLYRPDHVKRVYIPKPDGRLRPLGIPTVRDRIVQTAVLLIIEAIFEADFLDCSYGFRPGRSAHQAVAEIRQHVQAGFTAVYDADLQGYFDTIPHDNLVRCLEKRIADRSLLALIKLWLTCPVEEQDEQGKRHISRPKAGTPQGGVISPLLANLYLHWFEKAFHGPDGPAHWGKAKIVRYADDFVVLARFQSMRLRTWIEKLLEGRFQLTINRQKTKIVLLHEPGSRLEFLGYMFRYDKDLKGRAGRYLNVCPSDSSLSRARAKLRDLTGSQRCFVPLGIMLAEVNQWMTGWTNYFGYGYPRAAFRAVHHYAVDRLTCHLRRRSQRAYRPPPDRSFYAHLHDLGLKRP